VKLKIEDAGCGYNGRAVVDNISMSIREAEVWCILGANGIGKTTLFKTLLGLLKPVRGKILMDGTDIGEWSQRELARHISYVPQSHVPPFPFTVEEVVAMGRNPHQSVFGQLRERDRCAVREAIEILGIDHLRGADYTRISGGERQLTLLARAIAQQTPMLVLDEPVANLDFGNQARVISHVFALARSMNKTIVMTTHFPDHCFIGDCNALLLHRSGEHSIGRGRDIVTEAAVRELYEIENRIIDISAYEKRTCLPII
jgi:iron complex transport system ATP-binding protein